MPDQSPTVREGQWLPAEDTSQPPAPMNAMLAAFPWLQLQVIAAEITIDGDKAHIRGESRHYDHGRVTAEQFAGTADIGAILEAAEAIERQFTTMFEVVEQQMRLFNPWLALLPRPQR